MRKLRSVSGSDLRRARSASATLAHISQRTSKRRRPRSSSARTSEGLRSLNSLRMSRFAEPPLRAWQVALSTRSVSNHFIGRKHRRQRQDRMSAVFELVPQSVACRVAGKVPPATTIFAVTIPDNGRRVRSRTQHHDRPSYAFMAFCQPVIALVAP